ncbi:sugar-binding transcriptional regulator [Herbiconiux sp. SYSU D00978]|uniref:sugar-binding transcriptional regulator n=1 Tax=Herbiconiux sp. SYSU D00978 TaxID=2812562 RepID=UPI001A95BA75|nr:sugar-binding domain-containing protein [Herbiconiux sp. SYSU D00978]
MQDMTMDAIARELMTSRSSVSRLLSEARASGLVEIQIHSPLERSGGLEAQLAERFQINAHVVPVPAGISNVERLDRVAMTAARLLNRFFDSGMTLGVAWGSTMSAVSRQLVAKAAHNSHVVQLNGAVNDEDSGIDYASEILRRFGAAYGAQVHQFPVPAFFDDPRTKEAMWRERSTRRILDIQSRMDIALFGLGSPFADVPSRVYIGGYLNAEDYRSLSEDRVAGDVATMFYRLDGSDDVELNARGTGPDFHRLRKVARRVCVVSGNQKLASLRGALAAKVMTDLVVDEDLAKRLVNVR